MCHGVQPEFLLQGQQGPVVDGRGFQQGVDQGLSVIEFPIQRCAGYLNDLSYQGKTIGVRAAGRQRDQGISVGDMAAINDLVLLHDAHAEPRQVVVTAIVHAGHFRSLAAHQCAAGQFTAPADAGNHFCGDINIEFAGGVIIQEQQRLGSHDRNIVAAHGDQVDADRIVAIRHHSEPQFGPHSIGARHQHGLVISLGYLNQGAKAAYTPHDLGSACCCGDFFQTVHQLIAGIDVNTGVAIGQGGAVGRVVHGCWCLPGARDGIHRVL